MSHELPSTVTIVDDDPRAVERLTEMLAAYSDLSIVSSAANAAGAIATIEQHHPDLLFLDIDLPDGNGLELLSAINEMDEPPYTVMYTAYYDKYASDGKLFHRGEHDYLLKPIDIRELDKTIQRFRYTTAAGSHISSIHPLPDTTSDTDTRIVVALTQVTAEMRVMHISDIGFFRYNSKRKLWEAITRDNTVVTLKKTTSATDILNLLPKFIQTHQSYIVNIDYVLLIGKSKVNLFAPFQDAEVMVGRIYLKNLQNRLHFL